MCGQWGRESRAVARLVRRRVLRVFGIFVIVALANLTPSTLQPFTKYQIGARTVPRVRLVDGADASGYAFSTMILLTKV